MKQQIQYLTDRYGASVKLLKAPFLEISSTTIRERAAKGETIRYMVPDSVAEYIQKLQLYHKRKEETS